MAGEARRQYIQKTKGQELQRRKDELQKQQRAEQAYFSVYGQDEINKIMSDYQKATDEYRNLYKNRFISGRLDGYRSDANEAFKEAYKAKSKAEIAAKNARNNLTKWNKYLDKDFLSNFDKMLKDDFDINVGILELYKQDADYMSNYKDAEDYAKKRPKEEAAAKEYNDLLNYDLDKAKDEIEQLKNKIPQVEREAAGYKYTPIDENSEQFGRMTEEEKEAYRTQHALDYTNLVGSWKGAYEKELSEKEAYYNLAERAQKAEMLSSVADPNSENYDSDFDYYVKLGKSLPGYAGPQGENEDEKISNPAKYARDKWRLFGFDEQYVNSDPALYDHTFGNTLYLQMNKDEYDLYNYYLAKDNENAREGRSTNLAEEYFDSIKETLNGRAAKNFSEKRAEQGAVAQTLTGLVLNAGNNIESLGNIFSNEDYIQKSFGQAANEYIAEDMKNKGAGLAYEIAGTVGNMLPSIALSLGTGHIGGLVGGTVGKVISSAAPVLAGAEMGVSSAGNAYQEMLNEGYNKDQARLYGALIGASEASLQYLLGGISSLGGKLSGNALNKILSSVDNGLARFAIKFGGSVLSEITEEELQLYIEPLLKSVILNADYEAPDFEEKVNTAIVTALSTVLLEGPSSVASSVGEYRTGKRIKENGLTQTVIDEALSMPQTSEAYNLALNTSNDSSASKVGALYNAVSKSLTEKTSEAQAEFDKVIDSSDLSAETIEQAKKTFSNFIADIENSLNAQEIAREFAEDYKTAVMAGEISQETGEDIPDLIKSGYVKAMNPSQVENAITMGKIQGIEKQQKNQLKTEARIKMLNKSVEQIRAETKAAKNLTPEQKRAAEVAEALGTAVGYYNSEDIFDSKRDGFKAKNGIIFMDRNTVDPVRKVFVHELAHFSESSETYQKLAANIKESKVFEKWLSDQGYTSGSIENKMSAYRLEKSKIYKAAGENLNKSGLDAEMVASFLGDTFGSEEKFDNFVSKLTETEKKNFLDYVKEVVEWLKRTFTKNIPAELSNIERLYKKAIKESANALSAIKETEGKTEASFSIKYNAAKINSKIYEMIKNVIQGNFKQNDKVDLGIVSQENANKIFKLTGVDVTGFRVAVEARQIDHIIKDHGKNGKSDSSLSNYENIAKMQYVLENPDEMRSAGKTQAYTQMKNGNNKTVDTVLYEKRIGENSYYVIQAVPDTKAKTLYVVTAFIGKPGYKKEASQLINEKNLDATSKNGSVNASKSSISQSEENVNSDIQYSIPDRTKQLFEDYKNGKITYEEFIKSEADLMEEARAEYGTIKQGEKAVNKTAIPKAVEDEKVIGQFVRTITETGAVDEDLANKIGDKLLIGELSHEIASDKEALINADKSVKLGTAEESWSKIAAATVKTPTKNDVAIGERLLVEAMKKGNTADAINIASDLVQVFTRAGQLVQAASLLKKMTGAGRLVHIQRTVNRLNADINKRYKGKFPELSISENLATELVNAKTPEEVEEIAKDIEKDIADKFPVTKMDKWNAWRYLSMLGNPLTHFRNIVGNAIFAPTVMLKRAISTAAEKAIPAENRTRAFKVEQKYKDFAKADNATEYVQSLLDGTNKMTGEKKALQNRRIFKPQWLQTLYKFNGDALGAEDSFFKNRYYITALAGYLQAQNADLDNISEEFLEDAQNFAVKEALEATFNDTSFIARKLKEIEKSGALASFFVNGVVPFKRTPINIIRRGVEYSPIGLIDTLTRGTKKLVDGELTASDYINGLSSGLSGTISFIMGIFLASLGAVNGAFGDNDEDKFKELAGEQEYSLKIGNHSYTLDWAAPTTIPFFIGVELMNLAVKEQENIGVKEVINALWDSLDPVVNMSMLSGVENVITSIRNEEGAALVGSLAENVVSSYLGQALPTVFGKVASAIDPTRRSNYIDKNSPVPTFVQKLNNSAWGKFPVISGNRNAYIDAWGRELSAGNLGERLAENFLSPGYYNRINYTSVDVQLMDIVERTGDTSVLPDSAKKYFNVDKERKDLTREEYETYAKNKGQYSFEYINEFLSSEYANTFTDMQKIKVINKLYDYANEKAKATVSDYDLEKNNKTVYQVDKKGESVVNYFAQKVESEDYEPHLINEALEIGDANKIKAAVQDILSYRVDNGETEKEATSTLRSSVTRYWKPLYIEALKSNNTAEKNRIVDALLSSGLYGTKKELNNILKEWRDSENKKAD